MNVQYIWLTSFNAMQIKSADIRSICPAPALEKKPPPFIPDEYDYKINFELSACLKSYASSGMIFKRTLRTSL